MIRQSALAAALLVALAGCDTMPTREQPSAVEASPAVVEAPVAGPAANDNLNAVAWMQTAVEFRLIAGQAWRGALVQLDKAIKTPAWDALPKEERANPPTGLPPAIIVDVDETMLDNSPYQARLLRDNKAYDEATWAQWVKEEAARPVPGALEFARAAAARGVTLYYVTNRAADLTAPTLSNLRKVGFPVADDGQVLGLGQAIEGCEAKGSDKGCRRQWVGRSHRVLMQFGDQLGDFVTVPANTPAGRDQAVRPYLGWIGERWFVLPNPSYGNWEPALFNNAWSAPEAERRQLKLNGLRY
jgi:5'-nucleotidase (lipoprotein e(P4) family)